MDTRQLTTSDGHELTADVGTPNGESVAGVVVCHPHPLYGGNRFNPVVEAVCSRLMAAGCTALRFDFRSDHGGGDAEVLDIVAALDHLDDALPDVPLAVIGYSFGAAVALRTADERIVALAAIAPPLTMMEAPAPTQPTLVLTPRHDQFSDADAVAPIVAEWHQTSFEVIESTDHFLAGSIDSVAARVVNWLTATT